MLSDAQDMSGQRTLMGECHGDELAHLGRDISGSARFRCHTQNCSLTEAERDSLLRMDAVAKCKCQPAFRI